MSEGFEDLSRDGDPFYSTTATPSFATDLPDAIEPTGYKYVNRKGNTVEKTFDAPGNLWYENNSSNGAASAIRVVNVNTAKAGYMSPAPLLTYSLREQRTGSVKLGYEYDVTLNGYLLSVGTTEYARFQNILSQQKALNEQLLSASYIEVLHAPNSTFNDFKFFINNPSIQFEEGTWVDRCNYSFSFTSPASGMDSDNSSSPNFVPLEIREKIADFSDETTIENDDSFGASQGFDYYTNVLKVSRTVSATSRSLPWIKDSGLGIEGVLNAKEFVVYRFLSGADVTGNVSIAPPFNWKQYNERINENYSYSDSSYSRTQSYFLVSGAVETEALEKFNIDVSDDTSQPFITVSINGTIQGLTTKPFASGNISLYAYENAMAWWRKVSKNGTFGLTSSIYQRCNYVTNHYLNSQPRSVSVSDNRFEGQINYYVQFDNRPTNFISGALSEVINVNDSYGGDVVAITPVLGRRRGPVLQYMGTQTECKRDVSIELILSYQNLPYGNNANTMRNLTNFKPSINPITRTSVNDLINSLRPDATETNVLTCFLTSATESFSPKDGRYTINLSWVFER